eukprot:scaffold11861_cov187-Skeletonema_marinoi.AAC.1
MVTKIVICISSEERAAAAAAEDSNRNEDSRLQKNNQRDKDEKKNANDKYDVNTKRPLLTGGADDDERSRSATRRSENRGGSSKYEGVYFNKSRNKWKARISLDGKQHHIGTYDNEEEADVDYARAVFKYEEGKVNARIDLTDHIPPSSKKYQGVYFNQTKNKWIGLVTIDGKNHCIGYYDNEGEAAIGYSRAIVKCRVDKQLKMSQKKTQQKFIDLTDVPPQLPILKRHDKGGSS